MDRERFERLVSEAVESLPEEFQERLENIDVVVEDLPSRSQLRKAGVGQGMTLLGLYEGIPLTDRFSNYSLVPPDKISIFQRTIEENCGTTDDFKLKAEVRRVVLHEIAHHFGIGDARLKEIEESHGEA